MNEQYIVWAAFLMVFSSLSIAANLLQFIKIPNEKKKKSVFHMTVLSLSAADMIASAIFFMLGLRQLWETEGMAADNALLRFTFTGCYFSVFSSCVHIIFIAVQRLIIICFPLTWKDILKIRRVHITIILIWFGSAIFAALSAIPLPFKQPLSVVIFVSCTAITITYSLIPYCIVKRENHGSSSAGRATRKKTVLIHSFLIMATFLICTFPYAIARFYSSTSYIYIVCDVMFALNPLLDPVLYFFMSFLTKKTHSAQQQPQQHQTQQIVELSNVSSSNF